MTVKDLINLLQKIENKDKGVYVYHEDFEITEIKMVDELSDRVDLNI